MYVHMIMHQSTVTTMDKIDIDKLCKDLPVFEEGSEYYRASTTATIVAISINYERSLMKGFARVNHSRIPWTRLQPHLQLQFAAASKYTNR